ncbi:MAG: HAMP domain-containing sensor histidine kinase [candidate division WOR-3 bacterium]
MNKNPFFFKSYFFVALIVVSLASFLFIQDIVFKLEEKSLIQSRIFARYAMGITEDQSSKSEEIIFEEIIKNISFPIVLTDTSGYPISWRNVGYLDTVFEIEDNPKYLADLKKIIEKLDSEKRPLKLVYNSKVLAIIHMGEDPLYKKLQFAPFFQVIVSSIFLLIGIYAFLLYRKSEDNIIWAGMAKETAHQIGTPLTSLKTWIYMLKEKQTIDKFIVEGIEEDCSRLETVSNRFNKIGSNPIFEMTSLKEIIDDVSSYFKKRVPTTGKNKISIETELDKDEQILVDRELFKWALENLIKNSIDSLKNITDGKIKIETKNENNRILIRISDNGVGIERKNIENIFKIGFTTKKFGWGLGLPLAKKIIEDFHKGKLMLERTVVNDGTTFLIILDKDEKKNFMDR